MPPAGAEDGIRLLVRNVPPTILDFAELGLADSRVTAELLELFPRRAHRVGYASIQTELKTVGGIRTLTPVPLGTLIERGIKNGGGHHAHCGVLFEAGRLAAPVGGQHR